MALTTHSERWKGVTIVVSLLCETKCCCKTGVDHAVFLLHLAGNVSIKGDAPIKSLVAAPGSGNTACK